MITRDTSDIYILTYKGKIMGFYKSLNDAEGAEVEYKNMNRGEFIDRIKDVTETAIWDSGFDILNAIKDIIHKINGDFWNIYGFNYGEKPQLNWTVKDSNHNYDAL